MRIWNLYRTPTSKVLLLIIVGMFVLIAYMDNRSVWVELAWNCVWISALELFFAILTVFMFPDMEEKKK